MPWWEDCQSFETAIASPHRSVWLVDRRATPAPEAGSGPERQRHQHVTSRRSLARSQADLAVGVATISRRDPGYYALDLANLILGRLGLMGRLGAEVRDRQGLAYYVFSQIEPRNVGSLWSARAGVAAENVERALQAIDEQVRALLANGVTAEELRDAKSYATGILPLALETHDGAAAMLLAIEEFATRDSTIRSGTRRSSKLSPETTCMQPLPAVSIPTPSSPPSRDHPRERASPAVASPVLQRDARLRRHRSQVDEKFIVADAKDPADPVLRALRPVLIDVAGLVAAEAHFARAL